MQANDAVFMTTSPENHIPSDLQRVDAHVIQPEEYEEIPGQQDRPVVVGASQPG